MTTHFIPCRICKGKTEEALDLGLISPPAFLDENEAGLSPQRMILIRCLDCGLVQLGDHPAMDSMYRQYYYQSGINPVMIEALRDIAQRAQEYVPLIEGDIIVDIGANDGTSLTFYPDNVVKVAYEPALNIVEQTRQRATHFINDYFNKDAYPLEKKAKIITSIAMFYDLPDPNQFVDDIASILDDKGVWIMQISDYVSMLKTNSIDNPCFEHLEYYRIEDIIGLVETAGLEVFRIEHNDVNSGSLRFYIAWKGAFPVQDSVEAKRKEENDYLSSPEGTLEAFANRVNQAANVLVNFLIDSRNNNETVYGLAASTKANTLIQYFGIDNTMIKAIGEINKDKVGKRTIFTNIPIIHEQEVIDAQPDAIVIFAWHFLDFFIEKLDDYLNKNGIVISPLPTPRMYFKGFNGKVESVKLGEEWQA